MIAIVSSNRAEREALGALCDSRGWAAVACDGVGAFRKALWRTEPTVVIARHQLRDGFADDLTRVLTDAGPARQPRLIVLLPAGTPPAVEARQLARGADYVQRDPVRADVIAQYIIRCLAAVPAGGLASPSPESPYRFAGAVVDPVARTLSWRRKNATLTPREIELVDLLHTSAGRVVTYDRLYDEILGRPFRGDSSNLRVLLGKLDASCRAVGLTLRDHVMVIAKTGYLYREPGDKSDHRRRRRGLQGRARSA